MTTALTVHLPTPHADQRRVIEGAVRFNTVDCGRRWGKTTLGENRLLDAALSGHPAAWFAPTYRMLAEVWRDVRRLAQPVLRRADGQEHRMELVTGGVLDFWSLDMQDSARGRKYARVVVDEAAMIPDLEDAWQAVLRPTLTDLVGDAWFLSTPRGRNFFWRLFQRGQDAGEPHYASWQMPTRSNPYILPSEIAAAEHELPERTFAQEYLATFMDDGGGVFRRVMDAATLPGLATPDPKRQTVLGVDWGRMHDFTVLVLLDTQTHEVVDFDRFNQIDWHFQRDRLMTLYQRWKPLAIVAEENSIGDPNISELRRAGLPVQGFKTTNATKAEIIEGLSLGIERGDVRYPKIPELTNELLAYEQERLPSGLIRYGAPSGQHDDCVIALALAYWAASNTRPFSAAAGGARPAVSAPGTRQAPGNPFDRLGGGVPQRW